MSDGIQNLQNAIKAAAGAPFALDAAFLTKGLDDPDIVVPADYDAWIRAAFFAKSASDFTIAVVAANVGPVQDGAFTVTAATVPFVGVSAPLASTATLEFTSRAAQGGQELVVQVRTAPEGWTWTSSFQFMDGFPFDQLDILQANFVFSTADGLYPWGDSGGQPVKGGGAQNLTASIPFPAVVTPFLTVFSGLTPPHGSLVLRGALDMTPYNGETVLYPPGTLDAILQTGQFELLYLKVTDPRVSLTIPAPDPGGPGIAGGDDDAGDQAPLLSIAAGVGVGLSQGDASPYTLEVDIFPPTAGTQTTYAIGLVATGDGTPLSPSSIVTLVGGGSSYLSAVPPVLQQFLAFVSLQGLTFRGPLSNPMDLTAVSVDIGSSPNMSWTPIPDPTGKLDFTIRSFDLQWGIQNPFDAKSRLQSFDFNTQLTLAPAVFKGPGGQGDGVFTVQFTSGLQFYASFDGTATLSDFLSTLTNGAVTLENSVQAELSDIRLSLDFSSKSFSFASGFSVSLPFLEVNGTPVLSITGGDVSVAAKTPTQSKSGQTLALFPKPGADPEVASGTVWQSSISGSLAVGPLQTVASVEYDGFADPPRWNLRASLSKPLDVSALVNQFFDPGGSYAFPPFLPGDLQVLTFDANAVIPSGKGTLRTSYDIATTLKWTFDFGDQTVGIDPAKIALAYDGNKPAGQQFSGLVQGTWVYPAINLKLTMGYQFVPTAQGTNNILFVEWQGFRAQWESGKEQITFSLRGWSIGTILQALVRTLGDPYFTLPSPWDLLDQISLDGLRVNVSLKEGLAFNQRLSATYELSSPLRLGFIDITGLTFRREVDGKVTLAIEGSSPIASQLGNLMDPKKGQDVQNMPSVPGRGEQWFKLFLLVLGQRIGITGHSSFKDTKDVICALQNVPKTTGKTNPVDPGANKAPSPPKGQPYYDQSNGWLVAGHMGLLQVGDAWTVDAMMVFDDPDLYGLRLALAGPKVGGLANLSIDILYKKITDDIGVYQIEFTFPDAIRNLNFGAVSIVLPQLGIKVYTNGDFFVDVGFPYNLDFTRSFSISTIVFIGPVPVPILGSGGFYFGKLSNATSTKVKRTDKGTFDPVIELGVGLQLGLGYNFVKGPLKAGFAITVFGILEGVVAPWHPYDPSSAALARAESGSSLESDYYFKLSGTAGIIGLLYGSVDFAIISASVNVKITLSVQLTYEAYRAIPIVATATVDISLRVKIDLGLFSFTIKLSFSARVSAKFVLGSDRKAPWDDDEAALGFDRMRALATLGPDAAVQRARRLTPRPKRVERPATLSTLDKPMLTATIVPQLTVNAPEGSTSFASQQGAFVFLMAMDAPDPTGGPGGGDTSFDRLLSAFFPWILDTMAGGAGDTVRLADVMVTSVSRQDLEAYLTRLADNDNPVLDIGTLLQFLSDGFTLNLKAPSADSAAALQSGSVLFPAFDGLSLTVPDPSGGTGTKTIPFETYTTATPAYRKLVADLFAEVAAKIEAENREGALFATPLAEEASSMAALVFADTFTIIARQLLQAADDAMTSFTYALAADTSIQSVLDWAKTAGNDLRASDVALPNAEHELSAKITLTVGGLSYTIQAGDTLQSVADAHSQGGPSARWTTTPASLVIANAAQRVLAAGVDLVLTDEDGNEVKVTTSAGDTFGLLADGLGITVAALAAQSSLYGVKGLLAPTTQALLPPIAYTTADGTGAGDPSPDTLASVAALFATTPSALADANLAVQGLFSPAAQGGHITVANLHVLPVSDLWSAIAATGQVGQTAGMVSRFLTYGLRLPDEDGLTLSPDFLYSTGQEGYGLYQLTGQQFPTPPSASSYAVTLTRADASHGVDLGFVEMNGAVDKSLPVPLTDAYGRLSIVLRWAQAGVFQPAPTFASLPLSDVVAKTFAASTFSRWSSSDMASLEALTDRGAEAAADPESGAQVQPTLWSLPPALLSLVQSREAALESAMGGFAGALPLLPQLAPQVGRTSPATSQTAYTDLTSWAWATRVDFQIKRIPLIALPPGGTGAGTVPEGPATAPSIPTIYEVVSPSSEDALRLQAILTAMNARGEDIASGVFLLYNQSGPGAPVLVTPATEEFLAFLVQTNLSTETNPPPLTAFALADGPPRGIQNSPAEMVRLLWELSVVRSGAYYLYYEMVETGDGLPASVFDSSGSATLSLVVTFAAKGTAAFGDSVPDFVNAFVTTDTIDTSRDVVQLTSIAAEGQSAPLTGGAAETLRSLSAVYGPGPGTLAAENGTVALANGALVPVAGIVRQLRQADVVDPSKTLDALAAYYSVGAETPLTGSQIASFNPGVSVALGAVLLIPPVTYVVAPAPSPGAAPGNTFSSMAAYYGLSVEALAAVSADAGGLFTTGTRLTIGTELFDLRPQLGPGNLGVALTRENLGTPDLPPNPTPAQEEAYAKAYLYQLYSVLSAGLQKGAFFGGSPLGLPFGPQTQDAGDAPAFESAARAMERRRTRLLAAEDAPFDYRQSIGFGGFALVNAAPDPAAPELPPRSANPYIGVGTTAQVGLQWQDLFGNTTVTPFEAPSASYAGALNGSAASVRYGDLLIGLSGWPNVKASYIYDAPAGSPVLRLDLALDTKAYAGDDGKARAATDLRLFQRVYFQLHQDYTNAGVPGVTGNAVSMEIVNSLLASPVVSLADAQADVVRGFASACAIYLQKIVDGTTGDAPAASLSVPVDPAAIASGNILPLDVSLVLRRRALLTDPKVAAIEGGLSAASVIFPQADQATSIAYTEFATAMESVFRTSAFFLKVGEGLKSPDAGADLGTQQLWAVRFGEQQGQGIFFQIGASPSYYAPKPIARSLASRTVEITDYRTGQTRQATLTAVDQNQWFQTCLDAIDTFLSATYAPHAFVLDELQGVKNPLEEGSLGSVLETKRALADTIASSVLPVLSTSADDDSTQYAAQEKLRQQLLNQLGAAMRSGAVVVFGLDDVSGAPPVAPAGPPTLYGQPAGSVDPTAENQNFSLTPSRIPLGPTVVPGKGTFDPRIAFVLTSKDLPGQAYVPLDLALRVSHLELDRTSVDGIEGYVQSRWLAFVNGPFDYALGSGTSNVPVVNRSLPTPPTVTAQSAAQLPGEPVKPSDLTRWNYRFDYLYPQAAQDAVSTEIEINRDPAAVDAERLQRRAAVAKRGVAGGRGTAADRPSPPDLFQSLAQFVTSYPDILADLDAFLRKIDAAQPDPATLAAAQKAASTFAQQVEQISEAYKATFTVRKAMTALDLVRVTFLSVLDRTSIGGATDVARTDLLDLEINDLPATWDPVAHTLSNGQVTLPEVVLAIAPDDHDAVPAPEIPPSATVAFVYRKKGTKDDYLPYGAALATPARTVSMSGLDVLLHQSGWAAVSVRRNLVLFPVEDIGKVTTQDAFLFETPLVKFADPVVPRLTWAEFSLDDMPGATGDLQQLLTTYFQGLYSGGDGGTSVEVAMQGAYSYDLLPNTPGLPRVTLPINLLPPAPSAVDPSAPPSFISAFAGAISSWQAQRQPTFLGSPTIDMQQKIYGATSAKQPLVTIARLYHAASPTADASSSQPVYSEHRM